MSLINATKVLHTIAEESVTSSSSHLGPIGNWGGGTSTNKTRPSQERSVSDEDFSMPPMGIFIPGVKLVTKNSEWMKELFTILILPLLFLEPQSKGFR